MSTTEFGNDQYAIIGRVPVLYNSSPANLIVVFDSGNPKGYIAGVKYGYDFDSAVAKIQEGLNSGDTIDFVCDYYSYDGIFMANYVIGDRYVVSDPASILISNVDITPDGKPIVIYKFTDIYGESYWTPALY